MSNRPKNAAPLRPRPVAVATFALLLLASSAFAVPLHYEIASGSVTADSAEPGLVIQTLVNPSLPGTAFTLDNGGAFTFNFFDIWTNEPTINADDLVSSPISATLNFADPFTGATVNGVTVGGKWNQGLSQWGTVTWNGPVTVSLANNRSFTIALTNTEFNYGFGGLNEGALCGATVKATITQLTSVQPPEIERPTP
ncbi:MAG TPA: hypothetical protein VJ719_01350, partial [Chthoniobacterales bacterium]|nr:hypothetical protein [Chthoniobacterales bacterium]